MYGLVEPFQGSLATDRIAEEYSEKVQHVVASEPPSRKTHPRADFGQDTVRAKVATEQHDFPKPGRHGGKRIRRSLNNNSRLFDLGHEIASLSRGNTSVVTRSNCCCWSKPVIRKIRWVTPALIRFRKRSAHCSGDPEANQ